jgi:uncharacterized protein YaiI (UPF0178 family)
LLSEVPLSTAPPTLWLDADGAPRAVKEILFRVAERRGLDLVLVANSAQVLPRSPRIRQVQVGQGLDVADDWIAAHCRPGDVVITADVPLAATLVERGALVLQPRGQVLDASNVGERLAVRDFLDGMRGAGFDTGGPPPFGPTDRTRFANALDRLLTARLR